MSGTDTQRAERGRRTDGCDSLRVKPHRGLTWRELREAAGLSLRELEDLTGVNRGSLSHIEHGIGPTPLEARALLTVLRDVLADDWRAPPPPPDRD